MKQLIVIIAMLLGTAFVAKAQLLAEVPMPESVQERDCKMVNDPKAPCNQGDEPFSEFLARFCTDRDFQRTRLVEEGFLENVDEDGDTEKPWIDPCLEYIWSFGPLEFPVGCKKETCTETFGTWYGVGADQALYMSSISYDCDPDHPEEEAWDGGGSDFWVFERKGGKWYLTDLLQVG